MAWRLLCYIIVKYGNAFIMIYCVTWYFLTIFYCGRTCSMNPPVFVMVGVVVLRVTDCGKFAPGWSWLTISWYTLTVGQAYHDNSVQMATITMIYNGKYKTYYTIINHGEKVPCTALYHDKCSTMLDHDKPR